MQLAHAIGFGIFLLILTYLGVKNADGVGTIFKSGSQAAVPLITSLQGR